MSRRVVWGRWTKVNQPVDVQTGAESVGLSYIVNCSPVTLLCSIPCPVAGHRSLGTAAEQPQRR
jgi:hypothetical protein